MADTDFDAFTDVTSLQSSDLFLGYRGGGGINFTLDKLRTDIRSDRVAKSGDSMTGALRVAPPGDFWTSSTAYYLVGTHASPIGQLTSHGSNFVTLTVNGYRNTSSTWTSLNANGNTGAAMIALDPAGRIRFYVDANKATGSSIFPTEAFQFTSAGDFIPATDNLKNIGSASNRLKEIFCANSTINTSDEREKLWIVWGEDRRAADRRIARRILDELGWFQWCNAVAEKGEDGARWHFGARAQRVWSIVADEGLCAPIVEDEAFGMTPDPAWQGPPPPAWLCYDTWDDEYEDVIGPVTIVEQQEVTRALPGLFDKDGSPATVTETVDVEVQTEGPTGEKRLALPAGNRFGFRIDQLGLLLDWALHDRLSETEARQEALNARLAALEAG